MKITPQMILLSRERQCFSRTYKTFAMTPTDCIRFAVLSRIEMLHILLEHFYDSQRNERRDVFATGTEQLGILFESVQVNGVWVGK